MKIITEGTYEYYSTLVISSKFKEKYISRSKNLPAMETGR